MSLVEWGIISLACVIVFFIGYAGVTGKSIFTFKEHKNKTKSNHH